jgi:hypothetical protein
VRFGLFQAPEADGQTHAVMRVYALCTGYIELDRASMLSDLAPGQPWTVPVSSFLVDHPVLWNPSVMRDSLAALRKLRDQGGATMLYGHDPAQWDSHACRP